MAWNLKQKAQDHIVSVGLALIVLLLLAVWRAIDPSVWDRVSEATPKRALWALLGLAGIAICLLVGALIDNLRKRKHVPSAKKPFILYGVHWDDDDNPRCPVCECLMPTHHIEDDERAASEVEVLWCPRCKTTFSLWEDSGERKTLEEAKNGVAFFRGK